MNSSDFFSAHSSRHLCCKAFVDRQAYPIYIHRRNSIRRAWSLNSGLLWYQSLPCGPGFVVGSEGCGWPVHWFYHEEKNFIYSSTERTGPGLSAFKAPANRPAQKNATSDIISSQPIACPSYQSLVVGSGVLWTVKLPVKYLTKNATTDVISSQPIACLSDQQADHVPHRTPSAQVLLNIAHKGFPSNCQIYK